MLRSVNMCQLPFGSCKKNIKTLKFPLASPDINPIEITCGNLVHEFYAKNKQFVSIFELKAVILEYRNKKTIPTRKNIVKSFRDFGSRQC